MLANIFMHKDTRRKNAMNLGDAWNLYKMAILASTKEKSQKTEDGRWRNHIAPILGQHDVRTITTLDCLLLRRKLEETYKLSPQTVHHCLSLLRRVLKKAEEWEGFECNIKNFKGIMPKFDNKRQRFLNSDEIKKFYIFWSQTKTGMI